MKGSSPSFAVAEVTDPAELAASNARQARFERNLSWFGEHAVEIGATHRGQCICVAGQELFAAGTPQEALALARAAHPEDDGFLLQYIYREKLDRIYAHPRPIRRIYLA